MPYPPLRLRMQDNVTLPLNHWLDEGLQSSSEWKLGAGQTTAHKTLTSLLSACSRALQHPDFATESLLQFGGRKVNADASKFRFDAATSGPLERWFLAQRVGRVQKHPAMGRITLGTGTSELFFTPCRLDSPLLHLEGASFTNAGSRSRPRDCFRSAAKAMRPSSNRAGR